MSLRSDDPSDLMCYGGQFGTNSECSSYGDSCDGGSGICQYKYIHYNNVINLTGDNNGWTCVDDLHPSLACDISQVDPVDIL